MKNTFTKLWAVLCLLLFVSQQNFAQTSVQIGFGTDVNGGTLASIYAPICRLSNTTTLDFSRSNILYTSAELTAAGITTGKAITKIGFFKVGTGASVASFPFKIYMRNSTTTAPMSTATTWASILSAHTLVYDQPSQNIDAATGWVEFTLNFPFEYTGQNVEIAFDSDMSAIVGNPSTGGFDWQYTTGFAGNIIGQIASSASATLSGTTASYKNRPNILITYSDGCTGTPFAGDAISSTATPICPGTPVILNLANHTPNLGISYTWQSGPAMGGPFTDIPGSTSNSSSYNIAPATAAWYRAAVTCGANTEYSNPVQVVVIPSLNGVYTINPALALSATNFKSITGALNILKCGIAGPVVFDVAPGNVFNEQLLLDPIPGASATNTITFNGNGSTLTYANSATGDRGVVRLNGADHITIDSFTIVPTGTSYGYGVQLLNDADSNVIKRCTINGSTSLTTSGISGIVINSSVSGTPTTTGSSNCDGNLILNNKIDGGYAGVSLTANSTTSSIFRNRVIGNVITNFYNYGIYVNGCNECLVDSNDISRPTRSSGLAVFYGIYFTDSSLKCTVSKNRVHNTTDGLVTSTLSQSGIYFNNCDASPGMENLVINNLLYDFSGQGIHYGLYNSGSDYVQFLHNSVDMGNRTPSGTTAPTRGFFQTGTAVVGVKVKNNVIRVSREGTSERWGIYFGVPASEIESNNNDIYLPSAAGNYFGFYNSANQTTLSDWITATGQDVNSKSEDPMYTDVGTGNLLPTNPVINDIGAPVGVLTDYTGAARSLTAPDPGAYEFSGSTCMSPPTAGNVIFSAVIPICQGAEVSLNIENNSFGEGQTYTWQSSATLNGTYTDISAPSPGTGFVINPTSTMYYQAAVTCGGMTRYTDPVEITVSPILPGGNYTINATMATGGNNFQTFSDVIYAISCGIGGSVTFDVAPGTGPYFEQVILPEVPGLSSSKTITFNGNGNIISYISTNTVERATVKFNGTDWVTFRDFTVQAGGFSSNEYGFGIQLTNNADHNTIKGCHVEVTSTPATASSSAFAGIVISGSPTSATGTTSGCDYNVIDSNFIDGGYYGITLMGGSSEPVVNNQFTRNAITNFYQYGMYINYTDSTLIEKNDLSRPTRASVTSFYGIYFTSVSTAATISKNKIHNGFDGATSSTSGSFGVYMNSADGTALKPNLVVNNLVYGIRSNGPINGLYHTGSDYVKYYHNTVSIDDPSSTVTSTYSTTGIVLLSDDEGVEFQNNIVTITRGGNSLNRGINMSTTTPVNFVSNYNVIYINTSSSTNVFGIVGSTNYNTLADWKTANGGAYDQNSKSVNPGYLDIFSDDYTPTEQAINGIGKNLGITTDINDAARIVQAPDPGAIEFSNSECTSPPNPGIAISNISTPVCPGTPVQLNLSGNTTGVGQTYQWEFSNNFAGPYTPVGPVQYTSDFVGVSPNASGYFRAAVTCGATATVYSDPVLVEAPLPFSGTYTINSTMATGSGNFQSFNDAYNAMKCGIDGPVTFNVVPGTGPYVEQLIIPFITGMSAANPIVFNGNGEVISFGGTTSTERAVIKLKGAKYVTIDSLYISPTGATYNYGVHLLNDADNNTIRNCTLVLNATSSSTNNSGIVVNSSDAGTATTVGNSMCDSNMIVGNTITGGYAGVALIADAATYRIYGNKVINNTITDFYTYGVNLAGNEGTLVEGNNISRPFRTATSPSTIGAFYGVNLNDSCNSVVVSKNKIHDPFAAVTTSASAAYGIRLLNADADPGKDNMVVNNLVYNFANAGTQNGILNNGADNAKFYHNTISLDDVSASCSSCGTRGIFFQVANTTGVDIRNNIISITRGGTGDRQSLYFVPTSVAGYTINNNLYYLQSSATVNSIATVGGSSSGTGGTAYVTLLDWQATGKDANGLFADPMFVDAFNGDLKPTNTAVDNKGVNVGVTTDIRNVIRNGSTPDVGAIEFGNAAVTVYTFIGIGNWDVPANWLNQMVPPVNLPAGSEIIIDPVDGECVLNIEQHILPGATLTVRPGKSFRINNNLQISN